MDNAEATRRLHTKKQTLDDAYAAPANFLEIDVINPITHGVAKKRYTDYEVRMRVSHLSSPQFHFAELLIYTFYPSVLFFKTNLPVFKIKESSVRRRYSDFEWLRSELERDSKVSAIDIFLTGWNQMILMLQFSRLLCHHYLVKQSKDSFPSETMMESMMTNSLRTGVNHWKDL